jgi:hypothetical protein
MTADLVSRLEFERRVSWKFSIAMPVSTGQFIPSRSEAKARDLAGSTRNYFNEPASPSPDPEAHAPQDKLEDKQL